MLAEAILSMALLVAFLVFMVATVINCGGPGLPLCK